MRDDKGEVGRIFVARPLQILLAYPGAYRAGMSSLGYLQVLRLVERRRDWSVQRTFWNGRNVEATVETGRSPRDFPILAFSVAYELQLLTMARMLHDLGVEILSCDRSDRGRVWDNQVPLIVAGGPLTQVNAKVLGAMADIVIMGEAETAIDVLLETIEEIDDVALLLQRLAGKPGFYIPAFHGDNSPPPVLRAPLDELPAWSPIRSSGAEFRDMFLLEVGRGCAGSCTFCSMRRQLSGGARFVPLQRIMDAIPPDAGKVGLVGAEVSRHPGIREILRDLVRRNVRVGLSSLRADAADEEMFRLLAQAGMQSPTIAADGASERIRRDVVHKGVHTDHLLRAAKAAGKLGIRWLKVYQILGLPTETDDDIEEMALTVKEMARQTAVHLAVSLLVPKPKTPLENESVLTPKEAKRKLSLLRNRLEGKVRLSTAGVKEARLEWHLAFGTSQTGRIVAQMAISNSSSKALLRALERNMPVPEMADD